VRLAGQHALVTGGARGIGLAIAHSLMAEGARLTIVGRDEARLRSASAELGCGYAVANVANAAEVSAAFGAAAAERGAVSLLINNAGAAESAAFSATDAALWQRMLDINLTGTFNCTQAVSAGMLKAKAGRIVNIASTAGLKGYAYVAAYCAAKHGVIGLTRALALEWARKGITVNAVCPGYTETDIVASAIENIVEKTALSTAEAKKQLTNSNPQQRLVQPSEVASAVVWLCLPESASITGQALSVSGGEVMAG
jgi:NAD(P)-dependent dehydrogenase (short-subunit alcohol dehydrogenase family)